jgi:hypothetical protein
MREHRTAAKANAAEHAGKADSTDQTRNNGGG